MTPAASLSRRGTLLEPDDGIGDYRGEKNKISTASHFVTRNKNTTGKRANHMNILPLWARSSS
jgi:hypothetical protein